MVMLAIPIGIVCRGKFMQSIERVSFLKRSLSLFLKRLIAHALFLFYIEYGSSRGQIDSHFIFKEILYDASLQRGASQTYRKITISPVV